MNLSRTKTIATVLVIFFLALAIWAPVQAALTSQQTSPAIEVTASARANLRSGPGTTYARVGGVKEGDVLRVVSCNDDCTWYKTDAGSWILGELLSNPPKDLPRISNQSGTSPAPTPSAQSGFLPTPTPSATTAVKEASPQASAAGNLRSGPGTSFERVGQVAAGAPLKLIGQTVAGDWYQLEGGSWIASFLVEGAAQPLPIVTDLPATPTALPEPNAPAAESTTAPAGAGASALKVEFINPHYNCEQGESTTSSGKTYWAYRSFQVDMYVTNNGTEPFNPPWKPTRWIITDGTNDYVTDLSWEWVLRHMKGLYPKPVIQPGQSAGWTFIVLISERNQWAKAVEYEHNGTLYRQEFDLGPHGNSYNFQDCGDPRPHKFYPTPTPEPPDVQS